MRTAMVKSTQTFGLKQPRSKLGIETMTQTLTTVSTTILKWLVQGAKITNYV